jgi:cytochrome c
MGLALLVPVVLTFGPAAVQAQDAAAGEKVFAVCKACHQVGENAKMRGAHLNGVTGRRSGSVEGYNYSPSTRTPA